MNFAVLWLLAKVFSVKFGGVAPLARQKRAIHESFLLYGSYDKVAVAMSQIVTLPVTYLRMAWVLNIFMTITQLCA